MDTIPAIQYVFADSLMYDSLNHTLASMQKILGKKATTEYIVWIPFLSALTGGLLVLAGQGIERHYKKSVDKANNLREIYANSRKLEALMRNNYRELAMVKSHVEYWWHCHKTADEGERKRYYEEHLRSQSQARDIERRIGETKAEFIGLARKFQAIQEIKPELETILETISDLTNEKAKSYDDSLSHEEVRYNRFDDDEKELREKYYKKLDHFKSINDYLYTLVKQK